MKRFIYTSLLGVTAVFMGCVAWFYGWKPAIEGNMNFVKTHAEPVTVTVPLGGRTYVDVQVDGCNTELVETNQSTVWRFNDNVVIRTRDHLEGKSAGDGVMYMSNREVYKNYGDYFVSVGSDDRKVQVAYESLKTAQPYTASCPKMNDDNRINELPQVTLPSDYEIQDGWKLPDAVTAYKSSGDISYYKDNWYFNYNFRYQKKEDAVQDAATRVCALSGQDLEWWYSKGNIFVAKSGDEIACVKQQNMTSCYFISSNDLSYVLLNVGG